MGHPWTGKPPAGKYHVVTYLTSHAPLAQKKGVKLSNHELNGHLAEAAKEERIRVPLSMVDNSFRLAFKEYSKFYLRWTRPDGYEGVEPLLARTSPGLHVFVTARDGKNAINDGFACRMINYLFGTRFCTGNDSFITLPHQDGQTGASAQLYHALQKLGPAEGLMVEAICGPEAQGPCRTMLESISQVASFDLSWDSTDPSLYLSTVSPPQQRQVKETVHYDYSTQVSVLYTPPDVPKKYAHQLLLNGHVYDLDTGWTNEKSLALDPRHRKHPGSFVASLVEPAGLHPTLSLYMDTSRPPSGLEDCKMYTYVTLPRNIFADRYQLQDRLFLQSKNLATFNYSSNPVDLEAPEYTVPSWGSTILVELAPKKIATHDLPWKAFVPLHLRYMAPESGGYSRFDLPYPAVFWACGGPKSKWTGSDATEKMASNPWDVTNLGYDVLFPKNTVFWHLDPFTLHDTSLYNTVIVPVANTNRAGWVDVGTALAVILGTTWVLWALFEVMFDSPRGKTSEKERKSDGSTNTKKEASGGGGECEILVGKEDKGDTDRPESLRRSKRTATRSEE